MFCTVYRNRKQLWLRNISFAKGYGTCARGAAAFYMYDTFFLGLWWRRWRIARHRTLWAGCLVQVQTGRHLLPTSCSHVWPGYYEDALHRLFCRAWVLYSVFVLILYMCLGQCRYSSPAVQYFHSIMWYVIHFGILLSSRAKTVDIFEPLRDHSAWSGTVWHVNLSQFSHFLHFL